jgi:acyl carrier protein phosphodiesterase
LYLCSAIENSFKEFYYFCIKQIWTQLNYLAHIYLSGAVKQLQIGGFIADFVKGSKAGKHPVGVWNGIVLHRKIDSYTDSHPIVRELVDLLRPEFGRYSAIVLDMYFDHFLAADFKQITSKNLWWFSFLFSINVLWSYRHLPKRVKGFIFHFTATNRLYKYSKINGLHESLEIMSVYKIKSLKPDACIQFLNENKTIMEPRFRVFFAELQQYVQNELIA